MTQVSYLGHCLSVSGMIPDSQKVKAVQDWAIPTTVMAVHQFIGLADTFMTLQQ